MTARVKKPVTGRTRLGAILRPPAPWGHRHGLRTRIPRRRVPRHRLARRGDRGLAGDGRAKALRAAIASTVDPAAASAAPARLELLTPRRYRGRFAALYLLLALVLATSTAGLALRAIAPRSRPAPAWALWMPRDGAPAALINSIARHVAAEFRAGARGGQLVDVIPSAPPVVLNGTQKLSVSDIAVRTARGAISTLDAAGAVAYSLCGLGPDCSIDAGEASVNRGRLLRREALELALYTFRFVPSVNTVVAFVPPALGQPATLSLLFLRSTFARQPGRLLDATLRLGATAPPPGSSLRAEARAVDALTLPAVHLFHFAPLPTGGAILILDPLASRP